jgi:hypothetical protein
MEKIRKVVSTTISYDKVKYKSETYQLGDCLMIRDFGEGYLIGKLIKVVQEDGFKKYPWWPTIQVQWYYKKSDINREKNGLADDKMFNSISDFEVFKSNHCDIIFIETVMSKCKIYSYEEYESLREHTQSTFFCRASYDPVKQLFDPPFSEWQKSCHCQIPLNPDQLYIKCDKCEMWFHPKCCGIADEDIAKISEYFCSTCLEKIKDKKQSKEQSEKLKNDIK